MKILTTLQKTIAVFSFVFLFTSFASLKAQITCPYPIINNKPCLVTIGYELLDNTCACPPGCGPFSANFNPTSSGTVGTAVQCTTIGCNWDIIIRVESIGPVVYGPLTTPPYTYMDGGCIWNNQTTSDPSGLACGGWTIIWTASGATIF